MSFECFWIEKFAPEKRVLIGKPYFWAKRLFDILIVVCLMPAWLPVIAIIALAIRIFSPGAPVFFVQLRTGKGGRRFSMYKFRSMVPNAEKMLRELANVDANGELTGPLKMENDPRITPIGKFLRKTSLDELPQLFNVLHGEMSLVGPRPTSWSPESYQLWHTERLDVLPGITGLWQVCGRGSEDFDDWLRWDIRYIEKRSLWLDIVILFRTALSVIVRKGAR